MISEAYAGKANNKERINPNTIFLNLIISPFISIGDEKVNNMVRTIVFSFFKKSSPYFFSAGESPV
jgi:hypothetical protein